MEMAVVRPWWTEAERNLPGASDVSSAHYYLEVAESPVKQQCDLAKETASPYLLLMSPHKEGSPLLATPIAPLSLLRDASEASTSTFASLPAAPPLLQHHHRLSKASVTGSRAPGRLGPSTKLHLKPKAFSAASPDRPASAQKAAQAHPATPQSCSAPPSQGQSSPLSDAQQGQACFLTALRPIKTVAAQQQAPTAKNAIQQGDGPVLSPLSLLFGSTPSFQEAQELAMCMSTFQIPNVPPAAAAWPLPAHACDAPPPAPQGLARGGDAEALSPEYVQPQQRQGDGTDVEAGDRSQPAAYMQQRLASLTHGQQAAPPFVDLSIKDLMFSPSLPPAPPLSLGMAPQSLLVSQSRPPPLPQSGLGATAPPSVHPRMKGQLRSSSASLCGAPCTIVDPADMLNPVVVMKQLRASPPLSVQRLGRQAPSIPPACSEPAAVGVRRAKVLCDNPGASRSSIVDSASFTSSLGAPSLSAPARTPSIWQRQAQQRPPRAAAAPGPPSLPTVGSSGGFTAASGPGLAAELDAGISAATGEPLAFFQPAKRVRTVSDSAEYGGDAKPASGVCLSCGSQQTPQWRCGPEGPRTLCNACGVRYKKSCKNKKRPKSSGKPGNKKKGD